MIARFALPLAPLLACAIFPALAEEPAAVSFVDPVFSAPVSTLLPGNPPPSRKPANPVEGDRNAVQRGMQYFVAFNCVGCHAPNGGGGMGPSLSDARWIYGSDPSDIFLTIYQGRPNGMPAWGQTLPAAAIWDLVAYVKSIAEKPKSFGRTFSRDPALAPRQQTPAERLQVADPWNYTEPFTNGQKPGGQ